LDDIADFHCRFDRIHPFQDGNGRIGRMLILKQCIKHDIDLFFVNNDTRNEYINSLRMYHRTLSALYLSDYFKKQQQIFVIKYSKHFYELSKNEGLILKFLSTHEYISRLQVESLLKTKTSNAALILKKMVDKRIIKKIGNSNDTEYMIGK
jgi:Fic family protein